MRTPRISIFILLFLYSLKIAFGKNLICYWDVTSSQRYGDSKFTSNHLIRGSANCSHLVYASAHLDAKTFGIHFPHHIHLITKPKTLKQSHPQLKVYLSLGGDGDANDKYDQLKYLHLMEKSEHVQRKFINRTIEFLKLYQFDGLDLAFPLPRNQPSQQSNIGAFLNDVNRMWGSPTTTSYRPLFSKFLATVKEACGRNNLQLTLTVVPNVNSSHFYDVSEIHKNVEFINLFAFDFNTPERNPNEADYSAPLYFNAQPRPQPYANVDFQVNYWLQNGCPGNKLNLGIASYGRAWKLTIDSGLSGTPIVEDTQGPANFGKMKAHNSLLSWATICKHFPPRRLYGRPLMEYTDRYGNYAFRVANQNNTGGIWISYDGPKFAATKAKYAMDKALGGVVLYDLSRDDFRGQCGNIDFPILQSIRGVLSIKANPQKRVISATPRRIKMLVKPSRKSWAPTQVTDALHLLSVLTR
ncbi:chitinase-like protein Idgf1 [Musca domestica]|uniref:Chitinase-like protein Idgf1 n=1 Tax=Musca domestica TaxID=7370 RepID=A0A9J7CMW3_MUSDO|nr:chitinase-like protein Idgf1 [Musca domestica]